MTKKKFYLAAAVCLATQAVMLVGTAMVQSPTLDELGHLPSGYSHWRFRNFDLFRVNPPLIRCIATAPVYWFTNPTFDWGHGQEATDTRAEFVVGPKFVDSHGELAGRYFFIARIACVSVVLLGGVVCFKWAQSVFGEASGLLACILWVFCPSVIGYGSLITPDVGAASFGILAFYLFRQWMRTDSWKDTLLAGVAVGLAILSKSTWLTAYLSIALIWCFVCVRRRIVWSPMKWICLCLLSLFVVNAGYTFKGSGIKLSEIEFISKTLKGPSEGCRYGNRFRGTLLGDLPSPLPKDFVMGVDYLKYETEQTMRCYLAGEWKEGGWWYFYLYAIAVKVPLSIFALAMMSIFTARQLTNGEVNGEERPSTPVELNCIDEWLPLLIPPALVMIAVSSQTGFTHHVRYVLPCFPFAFIAISAVAATKSSRLRSLVTITTSAGIASCLFTFPHTMAYFNEVAGGPMKGDDHLLLSNIDWGQDMLHFQQWLDDNPRIAEEMQVLINTSAVSPYLGDIPEYSPASRLPRFLAVNVSAMHGEDVVSEILKMKKPYARIGYSIRIYSFEEDERVIP